MKYMNRKKSKRPPQYQNWNPQPTRQNPQQNLNVPSQPPNEGGDNQQWGTPLLIIVRDWLSLGILNCTNSCLELHVIFALFLGGLYYPFPLYLHLNNKPLLLNSFFLKIKLFLLVVREIVPFLVWYPGRTTSLHGMPLIGFINVLQYIGFINILQYIII